LKLFAEKRVSFPDPNDSLEEGIVDLSDDLRVERLLEAYSFGIFPWPHEELPTLWFSPPERGILLFDEFHVPRSLRKLVASTSWTWTLNRDFPRVIAACAAAKRRGQAGTWITERLLAAYIEFHRAGYAHSLEVWDRDELIGGLYGVYVGGLFCGESMFHYQSNASKFALLKMVEFLRARGLQWMDTQMVTPALESFGGQYISRRIFLKRLEAAKLVARPIDFRR
jgi:leucyl/phenylalanyl-tRNA--protein transferase